MFFVWCRCPVWKLILRKILDLWSHKLVLHLSKVIITFKTFCWPQWRSSPHSFVLVCAKPNYSPHPPWTLVFSKIPLFSKIELVRNYLLMLVQNRTPYIIYLNVYISITQFLLFCFLSACLYFSKQKVIFYLLIPLSSASWEEICFQGRFNKFIQLHIKMQGFKEPYWRRKIQRSPSPCPKFT